MKVIYSIKIRFSTVQPFYAKRTMFVEGFSTVAAVKDGAKKGGYEVVGFSLQHIMTPDEIACDVKREIGECLRAVGA